MKKILYVLLCVVMLVAPVTVARCEDDIKVTLDGKELVFDVPPQIIDNRTLVPMRAIFEALGAEVEWSQELQTVRAVKNSRFTTMTIGTNTFTVGDLNSDITPDKITLDVPPMIIDDRTLVPIRAVSESFDCDVKWDGGAREVIITSSPAPTATAVPAATASPAPTEEPVKEIPIEYDDTNERKAHEMRDFEILSLEKDSEGNYVMTYKLRTFLEGRGTVGTNFNCLDKDGKVVDNFGKVFNTTDYTWTWQEETVTVSGDTVKIEYVLHEE